MFPKLTEIFARFKPKLFVLKSGKYMRVVGPSVVLSSIKGLGGYVAIGECVTICGSFYFSGTNSVTDRSVNGHEITVMKLVPVSSEEDEMLRFD